MRGDPTALCNVLRRGRGDGGAGLCSLITNDRMHGNSTKMGQGRVRLDSRKHLCTVRVIKYWNKLSSKVVDALCLSALKRHLDNAFLNML